jgi:hypothetical protein
MSSGGRTIPAILPYKKTGGDYAEKSADALPQRPG